MFCALNGATDTPRRRSQAQIAVTIQLLPAFEDVPPTKSARIARERRCHGSVHAVSRISRTACAWSSSANRIHVARIAAASFFGLPVAR